MLKDRLHELWDFDLMGNPKAINIEILKKSGTHGGKDVTPLLAANIAAAFSTRSFLGKANSYNLKSIKNRLDMSAAFTFDEMIKRNMFRSYVAASEGKDETGEAVIDPLKDLSAISGDGLGLAVDVIDGTTLSAKGIPGAYTLSAVSYGLRSFPDLQAYAVIGPKPVIDGYNFDMDETEEVTELLNRVSEHSHKPISEICVVTHSSDTGKHHKKLIETITNLGAKVIVPEPVIVEPTHVLGLGMSIGSQKPDLIVGVFGLPEILINSLILSNITSEKAVRFRIASNAMLASPETEDLSERFAFSEDEQGLIQRSGLERDKEFTNNDIAETQRGCGFVATCLTGDPVLGIPAITQIDNDTIIHTIFGDMDGNVYKVTTVHSTGNEVDYTARYKLKIDDLSIVSFCKFDEQFSNALNAFESKVTSKCKWNSLTDMHITLFEIGVHYGGFSGGEFKQAALEWKKIGDNLLTPKTRIKAFIRKAYGVVCETETDSFEKLRQKETGLFNNRFCNIMREPMASHITLCQFASQLTADEIAVIDSEILKMNQLFHESDIILSKPELIHIINTPFVFEEEII